MEKAKPESREPANSQLKESEPELKPQAAADSFDENWDGQLPLELEKLIEDSLKDHKPNGPLNVACGAARLALRYAHSQGVARMQGEVDRLKKEFRHNIGGTAAFWRSEAKISEATIINQNQRISALERERDELRAACEKISTIELPLRKWTPLTAARYAAEYSQKIAKEALKRIGGGKELPDDNSKK